MILITDGWTCLCGFDNSSMFATFLFVDCVDFADHVHCASCQKSLILDQRAFRILDQQGDDDK